MSPMIVLTVSIIVMAFLVCNQMFTTEMVITTHQALAQAPSIPSLPPDSDEEITVNSQSQLRQSVTPSPIIQITSHEDGNQVPIGELTIRGTSSDNQQSNCQVYADANDIAPLQNATAAGLGGGDDYSQWTFTYSENYQLITEGMNELTAKISCFDNGSFVTPLSEWHSVNVTGVATGGTPAPTMTQTPTVDETLGAQQGANSIPAPTSSPASPITTGERLFGDLSEGQGRGEQGEQSIEDGSGDDDGGDDDGGDDDGGDDDGGDDDGEGDDG
jgi:hypothetical protein